jgi:hypothetical protein
MEVVFDVAGTLLEKADVLLHGSSEPGHRLHGLLEFLSELPLLLVPPGLLQFPQASVQPSHEGLEVMGEASQIAGEPA